MRTALARLFPLLIGTSVLLAGCRAGDPPPPPPRIALVQAAASAPALGGAYIGEIRARHEVDLAFRVGGRLTARLVDVGSEISPGQPVARLDPTDLELAANAARAQLAAAESDWSTARADKERYAGLLARKFVSQAAYDAKDNALHSAEARLEQARTQSRMSGNQAAYGTLSSDFSAVVTAVVADAGQVVAAGQPVVRIARPDEKELAVAIPENRLAELKAARELTVSLWSAPQVAIRGVLRELAPAADPATRTYAARIRLLDPPAEVRLGMTARLALNGTAPSTLLVPLSAVLDRGHGPFVRVVDAGKVAARPVKVAQFREDGAAIASGLQPGELVIVSGAGQVVDGQVVEARPQTPPERQR